MSLPIFIDIDGTLTDAPGKQGGKVLPDRIKTVRSRIAAGQEIVIWSGGGTAYAKAFAVKHGLSGATCIGKPSIVVDDNPDIRPRDRMIVASPDEFFGGPV